MALIININFTDYVQKIEKHSERITSCKIELQRKTLLQILEVSAPASAHGDGTVEMFYEELKKLWTEKPAVITGH